MDYQYKNRYSALNEQNKKKNVPLNLLKKKEIMLCYLQIMN